MAFEHENTPYGSYGEFDHYGTLDWTEADWADYDAQVAAEMAAADAHEDEMLRAQAEYEADAYMSYYDDDPNPYDGTYSEM